MIYFQGMNHIAYVRKAFDTKQGLVTVKHRKYLQKLLRVNIDVCGMLKCSVLWGGVLPF